MKRRFAGLIMLVLMISAGLSACGSGASDVPEPGSYTWDAMDEISALSQEDVALIQYSISTEGGIAAGSTADPEEIAAILSALKAISITAPSNMAVDDADTRVSILTEAGTYDFNFEYDILVMDSGERYQIDSISPLRDYIISLLED